MIASELFELSHELSSCRGVDWSSLAKRPISLMVFVYLRSEVSLLLRIASHKGQGLRRPGPAETVTQGISPSELL